MAFVFDVECSEQRRECTRNPHRNAIPTSILTVPGASLDRLLVLSGIVMQMSEMSLTEIVAKAKVCFTLKMMKFRLNMMGF